jgi:hypothetical protein
LLNLAIRSAAGAGILAGGFRNTMMAVVEQPVPAPRRRHEMQNYTAETFLPHVGRTLTFEAPCEGEAPVRSVRFELWEVRRPITATAPKLFANRFRRCFLPSRGGLRTRGHTGSHMRILHLVIGC